MAEQILRSRIKLLVRTYQEWTTTHAKDVLLKGEIGLCEIPTGNGVATTAPTVLFKVGDGTLPFYNADPSKCLKWVSALAADVHDWAKVDEDTFVANLLAREDVIGKFESLDTDTRYTFSEDNGTLKVTEQLYKDGAAVEEAKTLTFDYVTPDELTEILKSYYTKTEIDEIVEGIEQQIGGIDTGVHSVTLTGGTNNGTLKLTVDGEATDNIAITGLEKIKVEKAGHADVADEATSANHAEAATKVDNALTVKVGGTDVVFDGSKAEVADVDAAIEAAIAQIPEQTDYTVTITEAAGAAGSDIAKTYTFTQNGAEIGTINLAKELVVTAGSVEEVTTVDVPYAGAKVGDKYIQLTIANQKDPIYVPAKDLVDIYTAKQGAQEVQVVISNTNEISASIVDSGVTTAKIADANVTTAKIADGNVTTAKIADANVTEDKLDENVKTKLNKVWKEVQSAVANKVTKNNHVLSSLTQDADGEISYEVREMTPADIGAAPASALADYKTKQTAYNKEGSAVQTITKVTQNANGEIDVTYGDIVFPEQQKASGSATIATKADNGIVTLKAGATLSENHELGNSTDADIVLAKVASTGSAYDLTEANEDAEKGVKYFIIDCNW